MRTTIYVDGFNFYYRALKGTPHKWLNLDTLFQLLLRPPHAITAINYFTARVSARPNDPGQPVRQDMYLRALRTVPTISIIFGTFLTNTAVVVTNDSDLCEPIRIVRDELGLPVGILYPDKSLSRQLQRYASFVRPIRQGVLAQSQFPDELTDNVGTFHKPTSW